MPPEPPLELLPPLLPGDPLMPPLPRELDEPLKPPDDDDEESPPAPFMPPLDDELPPRFSSLSRPGMPLPSTDV